MMGIADMEMKTSVKPTPTGADNGINRIALALLVAAGAVSAMGVGLTIFLIVISDRATLYGAASHSARNSQRIGYRFGCCSRG